MEERLSCTNPSRLHPNGYSSSRLPLPRQEGAYSENEQTDGEGAYSAWTVRLTFTLAYLQTSVSRFLSYTELQQECPCSTVP